MTIITLSHSEPHPHLRRFDISRDLIPVADLVELCFSDSLDEDGRGYIRQLRSYADNPSFLKWAAKFSDRIPMPVSGFVWEQDGRIVGNLSLIPVGGFSAPRYLIANVAVHPDYRRRGIARLLTKAALERVRAKGADSIWLQVRQNNPAAHSLYSSMGFKEKARRTSWYLRKRNLKHPKLPTGVKVIARRNRHWSQQKIWLSRAHPEKLAWHMPLDINALRPGLFGHLYRLITGKSIRQWSAVQGRHLLGVLAWQRTDAYASRLWFASDPELEAEALLALAPFVCTRIRFHQPLHLEYPAGRSTQAFESLGFYSHQTLLWMRYEP